MDCRTHRDYRKQREVSTQNHNFEFDLNALFSQEPLGISEKWGGQVNFPHLITNGSFLPKDLRFFFVDPGIKAKYSYITLVPIKSTFLIFHCWFKYYDRRNFAHTAEKSVRVPRREQVEED